MKIYRHHSINAGVCWGTSEEILSQRPTPNNNSSSVGQFPQSASENRRFNQQAELTPSMKGGAA